MNINTPVRYQISQEINVLILFSFAGHIITSLVEFNIFNTGYN
jgi:hypothetical protein